MFPPPSQMEQMIPTLLICCIGPVREPPEWRSAGCYFHSITPCRLCCSHSSWSQHSLRDVTDRIGRLHSSLQGTADLPPKKPPNRLHPRLKHLSLITGRFCCSGDQQVEFRASRLTKDCLRQGWAIKLPEGQPRDFRS